MAETDVEIACDAYISIQSYEREHGKFSDVTAQIILYIRPYFFGKIGQVLLEEHSYPDGN